MPQTDYRVFPNQLQCEGGMPSRGMSAMNVFYGVGLGAEFLDDMKAVLADGNLFVLGIPVYSDFKTLTGEGCLYDGPGLGAEYKGLHAIVVVGYDDGVGEGGAFKCFNSWGTSWGDAGKVWLSYGWVGEEATEAWTMIDRLAYQPTSWARIDITHPRRGQLVVQVGVGSDPAAPAFARTVYSLDGGNHADIHTSCDITDGASYLPPSSGNPWFVSVRDLTTGYTGTLTGFSLVHNGTKYVSEDPPIAIPDNGTRAVAYVDTTGVSVSVLPANPGTGDDLFASVTGGTSGCSYAWYKDSVLQPDQTTNTVSHTLTAKGQTWKCVVTPASGPPAEGQVTIRNTAPTGSSASISPADPKTADDLVCSASATDADGDSITWAYRWYRNGALQAKETSATLGSTKTARGETWKCVATPSDGTDTGASANDEITIGNTPPADTSALISPAAPATDEDLVCSASAVDADGDSITWTYAWYKDGVLQTGETGDTLSSAKTAKGEVWGCVATPGDGTASGPPAEDEVTIGDTAASLDWVGTAGYEADGVEPNQGAPEGGASPTAFAFRAKYRDADGEAPTAACCVIQRRVANAWQVYLKAPMALESGDLAEGAVYACSLQLPNEVLKYRFAFRCADGSWLTSSPSHYQPGPFLVAEPRLSWTGKPGFRAEGVQPDTGPVGTRFCFQVLYQDSAGDAPTSFDLLVRRDGKLYRRNAMVAARAGNYRIGKLYRTSVTVKDAGTYTYRFGFADGSGTAVGEPATWQDGPTITDGGAAALCAGVTSVTAVPTRRGAQVAFSLAGPAQVTATVLNLAGRPVRTLVQDQPYGPGAQTLLWDRQSDRGLPVPDGTYLLRLTARTAAGAQQVAVTTLALR